MGARGEEEEGGAVGRPDGIMMRRTAVCSIAWVRALLVSTERRLDRRRRLRRERSSGAQEWRN